MKKTTKTAKKTIVRTTLRYNGDLDEFRVRGFNCDGKAIKSADYFTDDLEDAKATAIEMVARSLAKKNDLEFETLEADEPIDSSTYHDERAEIAAERAEIAAEREAIAVEIAADEQRVAEIEEQRVDDSPTLEDRIDRAVEASLNVERDAVEKQLVAMVEEIEEQTQLRIARAVEDVRPQIVGDQGSIEAARFSSKQQTLISVARTLSKILPTVFLDELEIVFCDAEEHSELTSNECDLCESLHLHLEAITDNR